MKIDYKKRHVNVNLFMGLFWLVYFLVIIFTKEKINWVDYGLVVISVIYLAVYFYQIRYKYLTITDEFIKINRPYAKQLKLLEIKQIKTFAGDYILKTDTKELTINTLIVEPKSLIELNSELQKLNIEWV